jgi:hypothetical protein
MERPSVRSRKLEGFKFSKLVCPIICSLLKRLLKVRTYLMVRCSVMYTSPYFAPGLLAGFTKWIVGLGCLNKSSREAYLNTVKNISLLFVLGIQCYPCHSRQPRPFGTREIWIFFNVLRKLQKLLGLLYRGRWSRIATQELEFMLLLG